MHVSVNPKHLKTGIPAVGILGALLRCILYLTGTDRKGLLVTGHWAHISLWILTAAAAAALILGCIRLRGPEKYTDCFPASFFGSLGAFAAAAAFLLSAFPDWQHALSPLDTAAAALSFASAAALIYVGICRFRGSEPRFIAHTVVCICFALRMVCQYRVWSADPQLVDYCFYMAAHVCLMLTAYQFAAFDTAMGNHRTLWFMGLAAVYFCLLCLWNCPNPALMLCCAFWILTNLTELTLRPRRVRPVLNLDREE
jgi:hypothetical protein